MEKDPAEWPQFEESQYSRGGEDIETAESMIKQRIELRIWIKKNPHSPTIDQANEKIKYLDEEIEKFRKSGRGRIFVNEYKQDKEKDN